MNVTGDTVDKHAICLMAKSVYELYNSKHKYCTAVRRTKVTFVRWKTVSWPQPVYERHIFHPTIAKLSMQPSRSSLLHPH